MSEAVIKVVPCMYGVDGEEKRCTARPESQCFACLGGGQRMDPLSSLIPVKRFVGCHGQEWRERRPSERD